MFRGLCLTFYGKSRVEPETEHHLHESSSKMTIPLMVLAFFSVVAGWVSWPKAWHGSEAFDRYLDPVFGPATEALRNVSPEHVGGPQSRGIDGILDSRGRSSGLAWHRGGI